ncbi:hypothetical protein [Thermocatellispora tengchongensis]|uniref:hypothetical protein n=1 Tax=Thermocatellispora tengchongensis TaxID=1073253 RepID=UPI0036423B9D
MKASAICPAASSIVMRLVVRRRWNSPSHSCSAMSAAASSHALSVSATSGSPRRRARCSHTSRGTHSSTDNQSAQEVSDRRSAQLATCTTGMSSAVVMWSMGWASMA